MRRKGIFLAVILASLTIVFAGSSCDDGGPTDIDDIPIGTRIESFTLPDLDGTERSLDTLKGENGAVLVWTSAQCPVVKSYNERIVAAADELEAKGISLIGINSNSSESVDWIKSTAEKVGYDFPVLIDKGNVLADKLGASVTPEFFYIDENNVLLYHGALDNDRSGRSITTNYLRDAFESVLSKQPVKTAKTNVIGCSIKRA